MSQPQAQDAVHFLARLFPSFREVGPEEAGRRTESLGLFVAQTWSAGSQGFQARGIDVPPEVHQRLAPVAPRVAQARQGGATFLAHLRAAFGDDARCAQAMSGFARVYAESLRGGPAPAAPAAPAGPAGAPAAAPAPAAPPARPAPPSPGSFSDLDLLPDDAPPARTYAPAPAPAPAQAGARAPAPAAGGGGLDLVDDEPEDRPAPAAMEFLLEPAAPGAPDAAGPAGAGAAAPPAGEKRPRKPLRGKPEEKPKEAEAPAEPSAPRDPAERAVWLFERSGDAAQLQEAERLLMGQLEQAPHAVAAAVAEAGLARTALLKGDRAGAEKRARAALARDPSCPPAIEVLVRLDRGEAERSAFARALAQLRGPLGDHDVAAAAPLAQRLAQQVGEEPHGPLALAYLARLRGDRDGFVQQVREAWGRYPSRWSDMPFGGEIDLEVAEALIGFGRDGFKKNDETLMRRTVEDVDDKQNEIAGALRVGVALCRVALAQGPPKALERKLSFAVGRGLVGLQYFDAALPWFGRASFLAPPVEEVKAISNERINAGALRRAFDRPGIKAQLKAYKCLGAQLLNQRIKERLEAIRKDRDAKEQEMFEAGAELAEVARRDPAVQQEISRAMEQAKVADPLAPLEALARELEDVERERAEARKAAEGGKGGGLFGKLKAAVGDAAREAKLKLKESQAAAKRKEAAKRLAVVMGRDLADVQWRAPALVGFARRLATIEGFLDYYETEERRCKEELERITEPTNP